MGSPRMSTVAKSARPEASESETSTGPPANWESVAPRVTAYLRALGIRDPLDIERLAARVHARLDATQAVPSAKGPTETAIEETGALLDDWITAEVGIESDRNTLLTARAAVLSGTVRGWAQRWSGVSGERVAARIRAASVQPVPEAAPLTMEPQPIRLLWRTVRTSLARFLLRIIHQRRRKPTKPRTDTKPAPAIPRRAAHFHRRATYFSLVLLTTVGAIGLLGWAFLDNGLTPLELALLILYAILILWISASFWTATIGFAMLLTGRDNHSIAKHEAPRAAAAPDLPSFKTALVMPVYNEDPERVFAGLRAIYQSLAETGQQDAFEVFILSDTRDPDIWVQEELQWRRWCLELGHPQMVFYRNRVENTSRKSGNLADFCKRWGGRYRYMIVLDADSLMSGSTIVEMVARMERNPHVALIQVPPVPVNHTSLFARMIQFAGGLYGRMFAAGLSYWQLGTSNYWGHNAIIRVKPFADHCGLPTLTGPEPFGGEILSHDFVEAALLRRAGWEVWLAYDLGGSYEEVPPTLIDYAKRDRRWCQGNLQHSRLVSAFGFRPISRIHFAMGVMSYAASPLWLIFLVLTGLQAYIQSLHIPVYFFANSLLPVWPTSYTVEMTTVLWVTLAMLFLPKLLALALLGIKRGLGAQFGGLPKAGASVLIESLFSVLLAPILMLFQSKFVLAILLRKAVGWPPQQRGDHQTGLAEAMGAHWIHTMVAIIAGTLSYIYVPDFFWWFTPVLAGLVLAVPVSMFTSRTSLGKKARAAGLFLTPEETHQPHVLQLLAANRAAPAPPLCATGVSGSPWYRAVVDPCAWALHMSLLPQETPSRRRLHYLQGLIFQLQDEGPDSLTPGEKRALLSHRDGLYELHTLLWSAPSCPGLAPSAAVLPKAS
jgi:membrane glycosyltransferase